MFRNIQMILKYKLRDNKMKQKKNYEYRSHEDSGQNIEHTQTPLDPKLKKKGISYNIYSN